MKTYETLRVSLWDNGAPSSVLAMPTAKLTEHQTDVLVAAHAAQGYLPWHMDDRSVWFVREKHEAP